MYCLSTDFSQMTHLVCENSKTANRKKNPSRESGQKNMKITCILLFYLFPKELRNLPFIYFMCFLAHKTQAFEFTVQSSHEGKVSATGSSYLACTSCALSPSAIIWLLGESLFAFGCIFRCHVRNRKNATARLQMFPPVCA